MQRVSEQSYWVCRDQLRFDAVSRQAEVDPPNRTDGPPAWLARLQDPLFLRAAQYLRSLT